MKRLRKFLYYAYSILEIVGGIKNWLLLVPLFFQKGPVGEHQVRLRRPPIRLAVRGAMDIWAVKETFLDAFYARYGAPIQDGWTVVDIGAGIGDFSIYAAYNHPNTLVYAYEPFPESYQLLIKNLTQNAVSNVVAFEEAVWCCEGKLVLDLSEGEPLQITSSDSLQEVKGHERVTIQAITLEEVLERERIDIVDLLKLDCEGAEYEILMKAPEETLTKIERIIMEYHDLDEDHAHKKLVPFLEKLGYVVTRHENIVHDDIGYLYAVRF
jgi:FkbM family methyltransferase